MTCGWSKTAGRDSPVVSCLNPVSPVSEQRCTGWRLTTGFLPYHGPITLAPASKMHELSIAHGLVQAACEALSRCEPVPTGVRSIQIRIGALSGVVPTALEFCYELSVEGTPLAGSHLVVEEQPVVVFCPQCRENRTLEDLSRFRCPICNASTPELVHGRELELISMELIDNDEPAPELSDKCDSRPSPPDPGGASGPSEGQ